MKVVSASGSFLKVELDSGEVGFVPAVMVEDPNAVETPLGTGGDFSVYPPVPDVGPVEPLPGFDATDLPPDGAIPTVIDPDVPVPPPTDDTPPKVESVPLPPSDIED
jgi:hypothetical protein